MRERKGTRANSGEAGFSLIELMVALGVTLVIMVIASRMLSMSMAVRTRENQRSEAVADVQRALQSMTREITNAGLGMENNGLVAADSGALAIRVRTNLNAFCKVVTAGVAPDCDSDTADAGEDIVYALINNVDAAGELQSLVTRQDVNSSNAISPLANRVDALEFEYYKADGTLTTNASLAQTVKVTVTVTLPAVGTSGQAGYQPATQMEVESRATLRNLLLSQ
ncbi:MAG: prepilin-type N-terminal cleavage/methylation domain-containing protein [Acidobacteria bacterium]|nr:prepilin-type N-terminal cleavage/methylation domain-containing protein [Acidobacteriota bacterium]